MKAYKYLSALLIAICAVLGMANLSFADSAKDDKPDIKIGFDYVMKKARAWAEAYNTLKNCVIDKIPRLDDKFGAWEPEQMYTCKPQLDAFKEARLNVPGWPQDLIWSNNEARDSITRDARLLDSVHQPIFNLFNYLVGMNKESKQCQVMGWYRNVRWWHYDNAQKYRESLKTIDRLISEYWRYKQQGNMAGDHFECSAGTMSHMQETLKKLGAYFYYNVDSTSLSPVGKGAFLYDLDAHSVHFKERRDNARRLMEATMANMATRSKNIQDSLKQLEQIDKTSPFYNLASTIPTAVLRITERAEDTFKRVHDGMEGLADTSSPIGGFLAQTDMKEYSQFAVSPKCSYIDSIRNALHITLLNTKDKDGKPIKHSIRGQL
ncbi:MAG: hypothetical protein J5828_02670 [Desulfovibrionaceae bacterium]|nr:hypothetical protein [Desulfovibrionaceae bacterium]